MRYSAPVAALLCASLLASPLPFFAQEPQTQTLNVDARLVVVPVTVRDSKEKLVRNLTKDDFTLTVDAKPQTLRYFDKDNNLPLTLGLMVDVSGSQRTVLDAERTASSAFLDNMLQPDRDKAFLIQFGHQADLLADVTGSMPKLQAALQKIDADRQDKPQFNQDDRNDNGNAQDSGGNNNGGYGQGRRGQRGPGGGGPRGGAGGGTLLYDSVYLASTEVLPKAAKDANDGKATGPTRNALILLTDGDDRGSRESLTDAIEAAQRANFSVYAIYYKGEQDHNGYGNGFPGRFPGGRGGFPGGGGRMGDQGNRARNDGKKVLQRMTEETGGRMFEVTKKYTVADIYKDIAEELRSQYRLGFSPINNDDGYHRLTIDVPKQKKLILQYRDGYYTGAPKQ